MPHATPASRRYRMLALTLAGVTLLVACSIDLEATPEPTATATAIAFGPNDVPVGTLLNESSAAWDEVDAWVEESRVESQSTGAGDPPASVATDRVILPDQRHVLTTNGETVVTEEIAVGDIIYMRGTLVSSSIYPEVDQETWISFSPEQAPEGTVLDQRVDYLTTSLGYPFADVTADTRALPASPAGEVEVGGRNCEAWEFSTTGEDSEGLDYRIAFDAQGRPCQLIREGGGVTETRTWTYPAEPEPITPPENPVQVDDFPTAP